MGSISLGGGTAADDRLLHSQSLGLGFDTWGRISLVSIPGSCSSKDLEDGPSRFVSISDSRF